MRKPKQNKNLAWREVEEKVFIIDLQNKREFHELNEVASLIWHSCTGENSDEDIARKIADDYEVEMDEALADVTLTLDQFQQKELIQFL